MAQAPLDALARVWRQPVSVTNASSYATVGQMIKRWPTERIALLYGAPLGVAYSLFNIPVSYWGMGSEGIAYGVGGIIGGAAGGAALFGAVCGLRNLIVRAK